MTTRRLAVLLPALLFLAGAAGYFIGVRSEDDPPPRDSVDVGFLYDMLTHHAQALDMASIELNKGVEPRVKTFAKEIDEFQAYEIGLMEAYLGRWGYDPQDRPDTSMGWMGTPVPADEMPGLATDEEMDELAGAEGEAVDTLFLDLMIRHHEGAVHMAQYAAEHAEDAAVRRLAEVSVRNQQREIGEMRAVQTNLG